MIAHSQTTSEILLIKPFSFSFNEQTSLSNAFQNKMPEAEISNVSKNALAEFNAFAEKLLSKGIGVNVFEDTAEPPKPDSVFPNNWISFHDDGTVILYPMNALNRRNERRIDIIEKLKKNFFITRIVDLSFYEKENRFLEGTGSIVFDHVYKLAYACISPRTDKDILVQLCEKIGYRPVYFYAHDKKGIEIYHTNVMMCVADDFVVICLEAVTDLKEREMLLGFFSETGHTIIDIDFVQMNHFAGNMLALRNRENSKLLALSQSAFDSLNNTQRSIINSYCEMIPLNIKTIETVGGGSARCMIAEIFLSRK